jgi:hypothetical protein
VALIAIHLNLELRMPDPFKIDYFDFPAHFHVPAIHDG